MGMFKDFIVGPKYTPNPASVAREKRELKTWQDRLKLADSFSGSDPAAARQGRREAEAHIRISRANLRDLGQ